MVKARPLRAGPVAHRVGLDPDQRDEELAAVADHHRLAHVRRDLEAVLDLRRRDVLAAGGDDHVLLAVGDRQEALLVDRADVAGVEPAVGVDGGGGGVGVLVVAGEHGRRAREDLAVLGDPQLDALERLADGADPHVVERHQRADRGVLGLAVDLVDRDAQRPEVLEHLGGDRGGAADGALRAAEPELVAQRAQGEHVGDAAGRESQRRPVRPALEPRGVRHLDLDGGEHLLPHARDGREQGRLDVAQVLRERLAALAEVDDVAGAEAVDDRAEPLGDVAQRQVGEHLVVGAGAEGAAEACRPPR